MQRAWNRGSMPKMLQSSPLPMWCFAENTTLFLLFLMLAVIHLNWLVQQRPERPICSFLPLRHNVRCHSARGPQLGSPVTDDQFPRRLPPWNLFTKLQSFPLYCIFTLKSGGGQKGTKGTGKWKKNKSSIIHETAVWFVPVFERLWWSLLSCVS